MTEHNFHADSNTSHRSQSRETFNTGEKATEFESVEDLLQYDRDQIEVPSSIKEKVAQSLPPDAGKPISWWRRLFR